jgi:hypothetical protein
VDIFSVGVVDLHELLDVGLLLGEGEIEDPEVVFAGLPRDPSTKRSRTSLLSSMRASCVRHRVELTIVAEYPATIDHKAMSRRAVVLLILRMVPVTGTMMPRKVA